MLWRACGIRLLQLTIIHVFITPVKSTYIGAIGVRSTELNNRRPHYRSNDIKYSSSSVTTPPFSNDEVLRWLHAVSESDIAFYRHDLPEGQLYTGIVFTHEPILGFFTLIGSGVWLYGPKT